MKDAAWIQPPIQYSHGGRNGQTNYSTNPDTNSPIFAFHIEILSGLDAVPNCNPSERM